MLATRRARYRRRVRAAFRAARLRLAALRRRDAPRACDAIARREADERGSRFSALRTLRERRADDLRDLPPRERSCFALRRVALDVFPRPGAGSLTPARRALDRPMAIACFGERAPCLPCRM